MTPVHRASISATRSPSASGWYWASRSSFWVGVRRDQREARRIQVTPYGRGDNIRHQ